jgi:integral membrane protein
MQWQTKLKTFKPFTEREAWVLFNAAAIGEAIGWTLLISGIIIKHYHLPGHAAALQVAGQIHGILFIFYLGITITAFNSLNWSLKQTLVAVLASVPPYGTLVFEQWAVRVRRRTLRRSYRRIAVRVIIAQDATLLAVQPSDRASWNLPGGYIEAAETPEQAVVRVVVNLTEVTPVVGSLRYIVTTRDRHEAGLEFYFSITNSKAFQQLDFERIRQRHPEIDEIKYLKPTSDSNLEPKFLIAEPLAQLTKSRDLPTVFIASE